MGHILSHPVTSKHIERHGNSWLRCGFAEMQGFRVNMEDAHTIAIPLDEKKHPQLSLFAIFDGHSGGAAADFMSRELALRISALSNPSDAESLRACVRQADHDFIQDPKYRAHGCTCCFVLARPDSQTNPSKINLIVGNVGDSRTIVIAPDASVRLVTKDHKPDDVDEAKRIRAAGGRVTFGRVDGELAMSRAIGDYPYKTTQDLPAAQQKVIADPDILTFEASPDDLLLIICDGLVEKLSSEQVAAFVRESYNTHPNDPAHVAALLLDYSLRSGSKDNMSAMLIAFKDGKGYNQNEFRAGPFSDAADDRKFVECYIADAKRAGLEGDELMKLARQASEQAKETGSESFVRPKVIHLGPATSPHK